MKLYCDWCERHHLFSQITEFDWFRIDKKRITIHLLAKCPDCKQERGYTFRMDLQSSGETANE